MLKSKKDDRVLPMFRLEINDPTEAEALISQNLVCQVTGIVYEVKELRSPVLVMQCYNCQSFGHSAKNSRSKQKCLICGEDHFHKRYPNRETRKPKYANCRPHVASYKECLEYKKQAFRQHVVNNQNTYTSTVSQNTLLQPKTSNESFTFTAEQLTKFVVNVVIQVAQPQVCYPNLKQDTQDLKSSICCKVSNAAKTILNLDITWKYINRFSQRPFPPPPPPPALHIH